MISILPHVWRIDSGSMMHPFKISSLSTKYQPIVDLRERKVFAYEGLTRGKGEWANPEKLFRNSYEEGYTVALDHACLRKSLSVLPKLGKDQCLFVNVEPITLGYLFNRWGKENLEKIPVKYRKKLVFELTEGVKWSDFTYLKKGVQYLNKMKCRFALDDVKGVGVKLLKLFELKPQFLKLDMSLIKGLSESTFSRSVVQHLIELSRSKKSQVVAEGVETKKDLQLVEQMNIHLIQGYYFAKPATALKKTIPKAKFKI